MFKVLRACLTRSQQSLQQSYKAGKNYYPQPAEAEQTMADHRRVG